MFFEKGTKFSGSDLWVNTCRDPEEVEGIVRCTSGRCIAADGFGAASAMTATIGRGPGKGAARRTAGRPVW